MGQVDQLNAELVATAKRRAELIGLLENRTVHQQSGRHNLSTKQWDRLQRKTDKVMDENVAAAEAAAEAARNTRNTVKEERVEGRKVMAAGKVLSAYAKVTAGPKVKTEEEKAVAKEVKAAKAAEVARLAGLGPEERAAEVEAKAAEAPRGSAGPLGSIFLQKMQNA